MSSKLQLEPALPSPFENEAYVESIIEAHGPYIGDLRLESSAPCAGHPGAQTFVFVVQISHDVAGGITDARFTITITPELIKAYKARSWENPEDEEPEISAEAMAWGELASIADDLNYRAGQKGGES